MRLVLLLIACMYSWGLMAQRVQNIKGSVVDKESKIALVGVTITIANTQPVIGTASDENGQYLLKEVPVGKHTLVVSYLGYQQVILQGVLVTSAKEVIIPIEMEESSQKLEEVVVKQKKEHINEMALVSAKTFDVQETERYAGSRADPARMASNFAGVQGANDSRNDIIIRGNSPAGVLWRIEDVNIPNPNHFSIPGTTGGPVCMLNNKVLANSDFFTGAFPSEYGNSTAGVFDLRMRNGNSEHHELTGQLGFLGTELAAEGPIMKKRASYLFTYRYSTLKLFESLNVKIGTNSIPAYQDAALKLHFRLGKKSELSLWGIGGLSKIDLIVSKLTKPSEELYGESDRDQYFRSNTGMAGVTLDYRINERTYTKISIAQTANEIAAHHDKVFRNADFKVDSFKSILDYSFSVNTTVAHWYINKKISARHVVKGGLVNNLYSIGFVDSSRQYPPSRQDWQHRLNYKGMTDLIEAYLQYKYRPSDAITITAGIHGQYLTHNRSKSVEPRLGFRWKVTASDAITFGYGLHSQMQPLYQYFAHLPTTSWSAMHNYDMGFTRSHHFVGGYEHMFSKVLRVRTEIYYQYLFNIPIETKAGSSFSAINQGSSFSRLFPDKLMNTGTGYNYGFELTVEKNFSDNFYVLVTGSVFDSKAKGNDGVMRNTDYNTRFATNLLGGYEYRIDNSSVLLAGIKLTYAGGRLYSPPDVAASNTTGDFVVIESQRNTLRFPDYFRLDFKLGTRINGRKFTHEIAIDLVNVLGNKNVLSLIYSPDLATQGADPFIKQYQLGFLPLFYYRVDFWPGKNK